MNVRLQGVEMYGGGPKNHYVFRAEAQRRRRARSITILLAAILAILIFWCVQLFYTEVAKPSVATADTVLVQEANSQAPAATTDTPPNSQS